MEKNNKFYRREKSKKAIGRLTIVFFAILIVTLIQIPIISAFEFDNIKSDLIKDETTSEYGKIEIRNSILGLDFLQLDKVTELELKENSEVCVDNLCEANTTITMYEDGKLIDEVRFLNLEQTSYETPKSYNIYINDKGKLTPYKFEEVEGNSEGIDYELILKGEINNFQSVDWQIRSQGTEWITEWATWSSSLTNGTIAYWRFDEGIGTVAEDSFANWDMDCNSTNWTTGIINNGLAFNGSANIGCTNETFLDGNNSDMTISLWVKHDYTYDNSRVDNLGVFSKVNEVGVNFWYSFFNAADGALLMSYNGEGVGTNINTPTVNWTGGTWYHIVYRWSKTDQNMSIWVNGTNELNASFNNVMNDTVLLRDWEIGSYLNAPNFFFNGTIDEVGVWDRSLTSTEISDLYNAGVGISPTVFLEITLNSPLDGANTLNRNITFNCSAADTAGYNITNISLYHNGSGTWGVNQTFTEGLYETTSNEFSINFTSYQSLTWNCLACNNRSDCEFAISNNTLRMADVTINETYNTSTWETESETFIANVSGTGDNTTTANLWYAGISYVGTKTGTDTSALFTRTLNVPTGVANNTFYWEVSLDGNPYINSTHTNQTVYDTNFSICAGEGGSVPFINFTFKDESTGDYIVNGTIPSSTFNYWLGSGSVNKSYTFTNNTANPSFTFCSIPAHRNLTIDYTLQYESEDYVQRLYNPTILSFSNRTTNTTLYLLPSTDGIYVTFQIINTAEQPISGVEVIVTRLIGGTTTTVGTGTSDAAGSVTFFLDSDFSHTFTFTADGYTVYTTSLFPTQSSYTVSLGAGSTVTVYDYTQGMHQQIFPNIPSLINDTSYSFGLYLNSSFWDVTEFGFVLFNSSGDVVDSTSVATNGGNASSTYNVLNSSYILMDYYWIVDGNYTNGTRSWYVLSSAGTEWSISNFKDDFISYSDSGIFGLDDFGRAIIVFLIIFLFVGIMSYKFGLISVAGIASVTFSIILFFDVGLGFLPNPIFPGAVSHFPTIFSALILIGLLIREVWR